MLTIQYVVPTKVINKNQNIRNFIVIKFPLNPKNVKKKSRQPYPVTFLFLKFLYLSGMWFGVVSRSDTKEVSVV